MLPAWGIWFPKLIWVPTIQHSWGGSRGINMPPGVHGLHWQGYLMNHVETGLRSIHQRCWRKLSADLSYRGSLVLFLRKWKWYIIIHTQSEVAVSNEPLGISCFCMFHYNFWLTLIKLATLIIKLWRYSLNLILWFRYTLEVKWQPLQFADGYFSVMTSVK